ncbi:MAG: hypothetical protein KDB63_14745 [Nocardioidaceae bacterium]|nr:hypothetical protein [Nocardioidaceae bacterium]
MTTHTENIQSTPAPEARAQDADRSASTGLDRVGGIAAQVVAGTYVVGFLAMGAYLGPRGFANPVDDPSGSLDFLLSNRAAMAGWYLLLYLVGGAAMAVVTLGVRDRLASTPRLARVSAAFGLIWSGLLMASGSVAVVSQHAVATLHADHPDLAQSSWVSLGIVQDALGGGIEVAGALWAAVVGIAVLRSRRLSPWLGGLALGLSAVGMASVIPAATEVAVSVFGIGFIVWFTWLGLALRRR